MNYVLMALMFLILCGCLNCKPVEAVSEKPFERYFLPALNKLKDATNGLEQITATATVIENTHRFKTGVFVAPFNEKGELLSLHNITNTSEVKKLFIYDQNDQSRFDPFSIRVLDPMVVEIFRIRRGF